MKVLTTAAAAAALVLATAAPVRAEEDCDTVMKSLSDALQVGLKSYQATVEEFKAKPVAKNKFCSATGEYVGTSRAFRAVVAECLKDDSRIAELDKAIKELENVVDGACK
jgi:hypothetical protein